MSEERKKNVQSLIPNYMDSGKKPAEQSADKSPGTGAVEAGQQEMSERLEAAKLRAQDRLDKARQPQYIAEHTVASGDTLGAIAQKYYQSAAREKWMAIYEANKEVIGDNPSLIKPGQVLKIPELDK